VVTYTVNTLADTHAVNPRNGPQDLNGNISLRSALEAGASLLSNYKFIVQFQRNLSGTVTLSGQADYGALPSIIRNSSIVGPANGAITVARSSAPNTPAFRIFTISGLPASPTSCDISNLTISNGATTSIGGGVYVNANASLGLYHVTLSQNSAEFGGGIYNAGALVIAGSTIRSNTAIGGPNSGVGGGLRNEGQAWIDNSQISGNSASGAGGGIANITSSSGPLASLTIVSSLVANNWATSGGGIYNSASVLTMNSGQLFANQATRDDGGGLYSTGTTTFTNVSIVSNGATNGGGVFVSDGATILDSCTINNNRIRQNGVGRGGSWFGGATLTRTNCRVGPLDTFVQFGG
jgi:predicted outer membrane repeat protein